MDAQVRTLEQTHWIMGHIMPSAQGFKTLEQILVEKKLITNAQLGLALEEQKRTGDQLENILQRLGFASEDQLSLCLADRIGAVPIKLKNIEIPADVLKIIPESFARERKLIPVLLKDDMLTVAMADVIDVITIDDLSNMTNHIIEVKSATESAILKAIDNFYIDEIFLSGSISEDAEMEKSISAAEQFTVSVKDDESLAAPIIKLVDQLLYKAIRVGATDIHIEPDEQVLRTRFRMDGIMQQGP